MALKPTIYKVQINLADSDENNYESLSLTVAQHPSETLERMTARLLAFCLNYAQRLEFTRGISTTDEPDLWLHTDSGEIDHWIEVGQPEELRLRKSVAKSGRVSVYAFGKSSGTWWKLNGDAIGALSRIRVWQFDWQEVVAIAGLLERTVKLSVSISGGTVYVDKDGQAHSVEPVLLLEKD